MMSKNQKSLSSKRKKLLLSLFFISGIMLIAPISESFSVPLFTPVVITFGDSPEVKTTLNTFLANYPQAKVFKYENSHDVLSMNDLITSNILMRSHSPIILIGHGSNSGIQGNNGNVIPWQEITNWVNSLPNNEVFFLSCNSFGATKFVNKPAIGFNGIIDGVLASLSIARNLQLSNNNYDALSAIDSKFMDRIVGLIAGSSPVELNIGPYMVATSIGVYNLYLEAGYYNSQFTVVIDRYYNNAIDGVGIAGSKWFMYDSYKSPPGRSFDSGLQFATASTIYLLTGSSCLVSIPFVGCIVSIDTSYVNYLKSLSSSAKANLFFPSVAFVAVEVATFALPWYVSIY